MKKLLLFLLFPLSLFGQQKINAKISITSIAALPVTSGLVTDFDFSTNVVYSNGKLSQITDAVGSVVSSQSDTSKQPRYYQNNGSGNNAYAHFRGADKLTGALLTSSTNFTMVIVRKTYSGLSTNDQLGVFQNGTTSNGYSWIDKYTYASGGYYPSVSGVLGQYTYTKPSTWETVVLSHGTGGNTKTYNSSGRLLAPYQFALDPVTPTTSHTIGASVDVNPFKGDICRILLFSRQLSDSEVNSLTTYLQSRYTEPFPANINTGGDSITATANASLVQNWPTYFLTNNLPSYYFFLNQTAVTGYNSKNVLDSLNSKVLTQYQNSCKNIYVLMIGHNNFAAGTITTAVNDTLFNQTSRICTQAHATGYKVILLTTLRTTAYAYSVTDTYNARLVSNYRSMGADTVFDLGGLSYFNDATNSSVFIDGTHLTLAAADTIAVRVQPFITYYLTH